MRADMQSRVGDFSRPGSTHLTRYIIKPVAAVTMTAALFAGTSLAVCGKATMSIDS